MGRPGRKASVPRHGVGCCSGLLSLDFMFSMFKRVDGAVDASEMKQEIAERLQKARL